MMAKFIKIVSVFIVLLIFVGILSGCQNKDNGNYDNYSYGLTKDGMYENLSKYKCELPDFNSMSFSCEEILQWNFESIASPDDTNMKTVDDYVYLYGEEFLGTLGVTTKEVAEVGDIVSAHLEFYIDGKLLENYVTTNSYEIKKDSDDIVSSFVGHKAKDTYEVKFTFSEDNNEYPSQIATVKVTINSVLISDPIKNGVVEANLEEIGKHLDGVTDVSSFLEALKPKIAESTLELLIETKIQADETIKIPETYIKFELYRLKARLQQLGYAYEDYLEALSMTDDDVKKYCAMIARENYVCMILFESLNREITNKDIAEYYGDNRAYITEIQGEPYMRLNMIRDISLREIADRVTLTYKGVAIERNAENEESDQGKANEANKDGDTVEPID